MDTNHIRGFFDRRIKTGDRLIESSHEDYPLEAIADAEVILCSAISALAARMWPGRGIDKQRFVQLLINFAGKSSHFNYISIPRLIEDDQIRNIVGASQELQTLFPDNSYATRRLLQVDEIDIPETVLTNPDDNKFGLTVIPAIDRIIIRGYSHAALLYTDLRSGLIHEYTLGEHLSSLSLWGIEDTATYSNLGGKRFLHFPYKFLRDSFLDVASNVFRCWDTMQSWSQSNPAWWIEGH